MSRKDYELIADIIRTLSLDSRAHDDVARAFAFGLLHTNRRFDLSRFLNACSGAHSEAVARAD
jgi:hypothetical protein